MTLKRLSNCSSAQELSGEPPMVLAFANTISMWPAAPVQCNGRSRSARYETYPWTRVLPRIRRGLVINGFCRGEHASHANRQIDERKFNLVGEVVPRLRVSTRSNAPRPELFCYNQITEQGQMFWVVDLLQVQRHRWHVPCCPCCPLIPETGYIR